MGNRQSSRDTQLSSHASHDKWVGWLVRQKLEPGMMANEQDSARPFG